MATTYFTASSLDGFIADPEHSLSWLLSRYVDVRGPMGYELFLEERVGALAMGSTTYEWILAHEAVDAGLVRWPYEAPCWVFTTRRLPQVDGDVRFVRGPVAAVHHELVAAAVGKDVWVVAGGEVAAQFADAGLLDELWVQYAPVTLGAGSPLLPRRLRASTRGDASQSRLRMRPLHRPASEAGPLTPLTAGGRSARAQTRRPVWTLTLRTQSP